MECGLPRRTNLRVWSRSTSTDNWGGACGGSGRGGPRGCSAWGGGGVRLGGLRGVLGLGWSGRGDLQGSGSGGPGSALQGAARRVPEMLRSGVRWGLSLGRPGVLRAGCVGSECSAEGSSLGALRRVSGSGGSAGNAGASGRPQEVSGTGVHRRVSDSGRSTGNGGASGRPARGVGHGSADRRAVPQAVTGTGGWQEGGPHGASAPRGGDSRASGRTAPARGVPQGAPTRGVRQGLQHGAFRRGIPRSECPAGGFGKGVPQLTPVGGMSAGTMGGGRPFLLTWLRRGQCPRASPIAHGDDRSAEAPWSHSPRGDRPPLSPLTAPAGLPVQPGPLSCPRAASGTPRRGQNGSPHSRCGWGVHGHAYVRRADGVDEERVRRGSQ